MRVQENKVESNAMDGQGKQITDQRVGLRGLSWIRPQMMQQVLSSISLSHENKAAHFSSQVELLKLFPESRTPSDQQTIANDSRSVSGSFWEKQSTADLTILYNGEVKVYNVSAEKAQAVMKLADSNGLRERATSKPSNGDNEEWREIRVCLGIARKLSLQRFLEKRKDRVGSVGPYASSGNNTRSKAWAEEN